MNQDDLVKGTNDIPEIVYLLNELRFSIDKSFLLFESFYKSVYTLKPYQTSIHQMENEKDDLGTIAHIKFQVDRLNNLNDYVAEMLQHFNKIIG